MKLSAFLTSKSQTEFKFNRVELTVSARGEKIALLHLENPIQSIEGSQSITDDASGVDTKLVAYDVDVVRVHQSEIEDEANGIEVDENGKGTVKSDMRLDVTQRGEVWLKKTSFAAFANEQRTSRRQERRSGLLAKMEERKTKATFKGDVVNTPAAEAKPEAVTI